MARDYTREYLDKITEMLEEVCSGQSGAIKRCASIIAVTSCDYANRLPRDFGGRHRSGLNLHEIAGNLILTNVPYGDGIIILPLPSTA